MRNIDSLLTTQNESYQTKNGSIRVNDVSQKVKLHDGQTFVGKYLHVIHRGADKKDLEFLEQEIGVSLPNDYCRFLQEHNGVNLFSDTLSVYGFGRVMVSGKPMVLRDPLIDLPYHLSDYNKNAKKIGVLKIGSFNDSPLVYKFHEDVTKVYMLDRNGNDLCSWINLEHCIDNLIAKLSPLYDSNGVCKNPLTINKLVFNKPKTI